MKNTDVPQDDSSLKSKDFKELCYAVNDSGDYVTAKSSGWDPKTIALDNTLRDINDRIAKAQQEVIAGKVSPIVYYMELHKMDLQILSSYVGLWKWRVKRHFKPNVFKKLSTKTLQKYADVFEISISALKQVPDED